MAILTGSACAVPVAKHPAPASASDAQNLFIASSLFDRVPRLFPLSRGDVGRPPPSAPAIARARAASCSGGWRAVKERSRARGGSHESHMSLLMASDLAATV